MSELTELLLQLVAIDSVNPRMWPGGAGEAEIARFVARWLERAGLEVTLEETEVETPNVVAVARGSAGGRSLILNGHIDTAGVVGMEHPLSPYVENGRLYGRGAYDMKGGLAAIMCVAAAARQLSLRGDVILAAVVDEEYASAGSKLLVRRWSADAAIVAEPTDLDLCLAHGGSVWLEIETVCSDDRNQRPSAIIGMAKILDGLSKLNRSLQTNEAHRLLGNGSLRVSFVDEKRKKMLPSPPESCLLWVKRQSVPGDKLEIIVSQIQQVLDSLDAARLGFQASLRTLAVREPFEVCDEESIVMTLHRKITDALCKEPLAIASKGWMDSAVLMSAGIPTVVFGPGGGGAHSPVEWADLQQVQTCADILLAVVKEFCG